VPLLGFLKVETRIFNNYGPKAGNVKYINWASTLVILTFSLHAAASLAELNCTVKGANLNCQVVGKEKKVMDADDIAKFVDASAVSSYITLKSRKGYERTFMVDGRSANFKRLQDIKNSASMSEIASAKTNLFNEIEKKIIKLSDELDGQAATADFVLWDPGVSFEKFKREAREMQTELDGYHKNKDKVCTSTPAFEAVSHSNARLQQTLSNIVYSWQTPGTCMSSYKIFKDKDGAMDLRQLDSSVAHYKNECKK
jgi:hypothetical protein